MTTASILLCVANFSEGRRKEAIDSIVEAAANPMVRILDLHSDHDHNRSVLTAAAPAFALVEAMVSATREAARLIDISIHEGAHPRMGAMDVLPFVPALNSTIKDAVPAARMTAEQIAGRLGIPCFLYEWAATSEDRRNLPDIRKAAFTRWAPDYGGPASHPTAGATVVGAREPLAACNVNLSTQDVEVARRIAREIRSSGGGLPHLRALGMDLPSRGLVQISMNLLRPLVTTVADAVDAITRSAQNHGVDTVETELVGLVPKGALGGRDPESLGLKISPKILEEELSRAFAETN